MCSPINLNYTLKMCNEKLSVFQTFQLNPEEEPRGILFD